MLEFLYVWLCLGTLHFVCYANKTSNGIFGLLGLWIVCLIIGPPFFFYELYKSIRS